MTYCLPRQLANLMKAKMKSGEITPQVLIDLGSKGRREFFAEFLGKQNAKEINAMFEAKLLLKGREKGILNWAKQVTGMKPDAKRDLISRVNKMGNILEPEKADDFLADIAEKRLGVELTVEEAGKIAELGRIADETKAEMEAGGDRFKHGAAKVAFYNYTNDLKSEAAKTTVVQYLKKPWKAIIDLGGVAKSVKASIDNSALFRQGYKVLVNHPIIWAKQAGNSFLNIAKTIERTAAEDLEKLVKLTTGKEVTIPKFQKVMDVVNADVFSRENYDLYVKAKLAIGNVEEAFPSTFPEKIPIFRSLYEASSDAYTAFMYRTRVDIFDQYIGVAKRTGVEIDKEQLEAIGALVNSLTGRAGLGSWEGAGKPLNNVFFAPRWALSQLDTLTLGQLGKNTAFTRKIAAKNSLRSILGMGAILTIANAVNPDSVEVDARSSDFGKIRIGDTRFDVSAGMAPWVVLGMRRIKKSTKSSVTEKVVPIGGDEFGSKEPIELIYDFAENKLSPIASVIKSMWNGKDWDGNPMTWETALKDLTVPLPISNALESMDEENAANLMLIMIADGLGIGANTYSKKLTDAEKLYQSLSEMPPAEANKYVNELKEKNPTLHKLLEKEKERQDLGMTPQDDYIKTLGVKNQGRAMYLWDEMEGMTAEEKNLYMDDMKAKKILTEDVAKQINQFIEDGGYEEPEEEREGNIITDYAKAFVTDKEVAFKALFTKEKLAKVEDGVVSLERIIGAEESNRIKKERGYGSVLDEVKLEHLIPLWVGGDNSDENLIVVPNGIHDQYTEVEMYLLDKVKNKKTLSKEKAREIFKKLKIDYADPTSLSSITIDEIYDKY